MLTVDGESKGGEPVTGFFTDTVQLLSLGALCIMLLPGLALCLYAFVRLVASLKDVVCDELEQLTHAKRYRDEP
jgi:hypothetical protein